MKRAGIRDPTFLVILAHFRAEKVAFAIFEPVWLSRTCENVMRAEDNCSVLSSLCSIQCAVIQRNGWSWGSDHISAVKDILPRASYRVDFKHQTCHMVP